jgi:hypothetical protein
MSAKANNLFFSLAESIVQTLNVTSCYVYGGTNMEYHWPWKARELDPWEHCNETAFPKHRKGIWVLKTSIIGNYCVSSPEGQLSTSVGDLTCLGWKFYNNTAQKTQQWGVPSHTKCQPHLANFSNLHKAWDNLTTNIDWWTPKGLYWISGKQAYMVFPRTCFGSCVLGSISPSFFLLPQRQGKKLGVPI